MYERVRKVLEAEAGEHTRTSLYRTEVRPFEAPDTGKIAVKVINHYGDEVMKVFKV